MSAPKAKKSEPVWNAGAPRPNMRRDSDAAITAWSVATVAATAAPPKAAGVKHFALLSANAVGMSDLNANTPFATTMRFKKKGEDALAASGVPYTILRPTGLVDQPGGQHGIALLSRGLAVSAVICREDVATVMVQALSTPNAAGKTIHFFNVVSRDPFAWMKDFPKLAI